MVEVSRKGAVQPVHLTSNRCASHPRGTSLLHGDICDVELLHKANMHMIIQSDTLQLPKSGI